MMTNPPLPPAGEGRGEDAKSQSTDAATLTKLLTWLSPAFPTGGFAYSHGLEWAVESGDVTTEPALLLWLTDILRHGSGQTDAILLRHAYRAETAAALAEIADLARAVQPCHERRAETLGQGEAFTIAARVWGAPLLDALATAPAHPVAIGALARAQSVPEDPATLAFLQATAANLISAAVRLIPLGQTAGLRVLAGLEPLLHTIAATTRTLTIDDIGSACFRSDIAAMRHETQYTRLFRS